jgi:hypothetical protein
MHFLTTSILHHVIAIVGSLPHFHRTIVQINAYSVHCLYPPQPWQFLPRWFFPNVNWVAKRKLGQIKGTKKCIIVPQLLWRNSSGSLLKGGRGPMPKRANLNARIEIPNLHELSDMHRLHRMMLPLILKKTIF